MIKNEVTLAEFEEMIKEAVSLLPEKIMRKIENIEFVIEQRHSPNNFFFALYHGVPQTKRGVGYTFVLPDKITFYKKTMEKYARDRQELQKLVRRVVWHEIGHHFGFTEKQIRKLESKWDG